MIEDPTLGRLHGTAQWRRVDRRGDRQAAKPPAQGGRLRDPEVSQRMVSDPMRQLTGMLISQVMPVTDIPGNHTSHEAAPASNDPEIMVSAPVTTAPVSPLRLHTSTAERTGLGWRSRPPQQDPGCLKIPASAQQAPSPTEGQKVALCDYRSGRRDEISADLHAGGVLHRGRDRSSDQAVLAGRRGMDVTPGFLRNGLAPWPRGILLYCCSPRRRPNPASRPLTAHFDTLRESRRVPCTEVASGYLWTAIQNNHLHLDLPSFAPLACSCKKW